MSRYALIDTNSGYVWWVGDADSPTAACAQADHEVGGRDSNAGAEYRWVGPREAGDGYLVYEAPAGFDVADGQDAAEIGRVSALRLSGRYHQVRT